MTRDNRIVDSPCFYKPGLVADDDGSPLGHVVDIAHTAAGWRVLVVDQGGELKDFPAEALTLTSAKKSTKAGDAKTT